MATYCPLFLPGRLSNGTGGGGGGGGGFTPTTQVVPPWKSGISLLPSGVYGTDYLVQVYSHAPKRHAGFVVYLKSNSLFDFQPNEQDVLNFRPGSTVSATGVSGAGVIRYRVDQEQSGSRGAWTNTAPFAGQGFPVWSGAKSFSQLQYPGGIDVVGAHGPVPGVTPSNATYMNTLYYIRGLLDEVNNPFHTIAVANDDSGISSPPLAGAGGQINTAYQGDGRYCVYCVNPLTPMAACIARDASARFKITPAKIPGTAVIHPQIVYASGNVSLDVAALDAQACQYSLVPVGNSPSWNDVTATIDLALLSANTRYTLSMRITGSGVVKTMTVHYAPGFPSDGETHPNSILWSAADGINDLIEKLNDPNPTTPTRYRYAHNYNYFKTQASYNADPPYDIPLNDGKRTREQFGFTPLVAALVALVEGYGGSPTHETLLHDAMLDNSLNIEPVGWELGHEPGTPTPERTQAGGYYTGDVALGLAIAYDWHCKTFRKPGQSRGLDAIEELEVRDLLAGFVHVAALDLIYPVSNVINADGNDSGMWSAAYAAWAMLIAAVMPNYDTPYYGASGAPGGSALTGRLHTPWPNESPTWWSWTNAKAADFTVLGAPNRAKGSGIWGCLAPTVAAPYAIWSRDGNGYLSDYAEMGHVYYFLMAFRANYDGHHWAHLDTGMKLLAQAALPAPSGAGQPQTCYFVGLVSELFPEIAAIIDVQMQNLYVDGGNPTLNFYHTEGYKQGIAFLLLYKDDWQSRP